MLPSTSMSQSHEVSLTRLKTSACGCRGWSSDGKTYTGYFCTHYPLIIFILFPLCQCSFCVLMPRGLRPFLQAKTEPSQKEKQTPKGVFWLFVFSSLEPTYTTVPKSAQGLQSSIWGNQSLIPPCLLPWLTGSIVHRNIPLR